MGLSSSLTGAYTHAGAFAIDPLTPTQKIGALRMQLLFAVHKYNIRLDHPILGLNHRAKTPSLTSNLHPFRNINRHHFRPFSLPAPTVVRITMSITAF